MAKLAPLSAAELGEELAALHLSATTDLRGLHALLMRATPLSDDAPRVALSGLARQLGALPDDLGDDLPPRPRTVFRLLRAGAVDAAWAVLIDNAMGVVDEPVNASTSSGSSRKAWRLPLLIRIEPPTVFADLPGLRDPRFRAPDECYDVTPLVRLRHQLDEVVIVGDQVTFGGWAALDPLSTAPTDRIRVIATSGDLEVALTGRRHRRADRSAGKASRSGRRVWSGWSAGLDLTDPRLAAGTWALSLEVDQCGITRRVKLGTRTSELARTATKAVTRVGTRTMRWRTDEPQWRLQVG